MPLDIDIEAYEGPLDLLLLLIEREELPIAEISLSHIADQYLEQIAALPEREAENLASFLVIAAQLLLIKSRALLPQEEQQEAEEVVGDLTARLRELAAFRKAGASMRELLRQERTMFEPRFVPPTTPFFSAEGADITRLATSLQNLLAGIVKERRLLAEETIQQTVTLEERLTHIRALLKYGQTISFSKLISKATSKTDLIVMFLSALELIKQREASVEQMENFADIVIRPR